MEGGGLESLFGLLRTFTLRTSFTASSMKTLLRALMHGHIYIYIIFSPEPPEPSTQCPSNTLRFASFYPRCFAVNDYLVTSFFSFFPSFLSVSSIPSLMKMLHSNLQPCCGPRLFDHYTILSLVLDFLTPPCGIVPKMPLESHK